MHSKEEESFLYIKLTLSIATQEELVKDFSTYFLIFFSDKELKHSSCFLNFLTIENRLGYGVGVFVNNCFVFGKEGIRAKDFLFNLFKKLKKKPAYSAGFFYFPCLFLSFV
ncbi:hypothetical protein [Halobacteriovorax sp. DA5]|uniref:hypothetical protein n=1 Tax=Halobacteriovorax sp. DA5 TaxID=2067553 RepID=UPI000CD1E61B|nr:hypothetical protein [Halobacteriovorax sp. DA5]POB12998.1 hypothetical protein C0Z22_10775 [Halobacteriovorax sp. DA5]